MPINLEHTINSGQVFLWERHGTKWYGVNGSDVLAVDESEPSRVLSHSGIHYDLFRQGDDFDGIIRKISKDDTIRKAATKFSGLRLLRQDPFQCYVSFIVSSNSSIQNIRLTLQRISKKFGKKITFEGKVFYLFPEPKKLAAASSADLISCGLGYRVKFVKNAAIAVKEGLIDFDSLKKSSYYDTGESLLGVDGIGNKVADCIMLFSLEKKEAFPLDRWIIRGLQEYYPERFSFGGKTLTDRKYQTLHDELVDYFGPNAGYCQQFLFKMIRDSNKKKWL
jgi:N-glycosylase/DNA lyase